ncbi:MAG: histidine kinase, partial [bacterium]|nr:histidine kinase [bacterium]
MDYLWVGTEGGLIKFDKKTGTSTLYANEANNPKSLSNNFVTSIVEDSAKDLWIATSKGLNKFDRKTQTFTCYTKQADNPKSIGSSFILWLLKDSSDNLWIGTYGGGLNKFNPETRTFTRYTNDANNPKSISDNTIPKIYEDSKGTLWIGTDRGLNIFDRKTQTFTRYLNQADNPKSISHNSVFTILEDTSGDMWIGTYGGGLNKFDRKTETFTRYREKDGLSSDSIYGILEDNKGNLWMSTNNGLSKLNPKTLTFTNYDKRDGLLNSEFGSGSHFKDRFGRMYFGGTNGVDEFHPDDIRDNTYIPPVVITDFLLFNKPVKISKTNAESEELQLKQHVNFTKEITLDYTDYIFAFEFSVLNYRQSDKNQFAYKLEGFDKDWVETDYRHRRVTYTDLSHGEYIFKVKGSNDDGYWNQDGA